MAIHPFRCDTLLAAKLSAIPSDEEITLSVFLMPKNKAPVLMGSWLNSFGTLGL